MEAHRADLPADEVTVVDGIPTTTVSRTIFDLAAVASPQETRRAINEAEFLRLTDPLSLDDLVHRHRGQRGAGVIRAIVAESKMGETVTRSVLEDRFLAFLDANGLPRPAMNVSVEGFEVDCLWPDQRLVVELDGHASHSTRITFEGDRARDRALAVAGYTVIRVTWRQLHREPDVLFGDLRRLLGRPRAPSRAARGSVRRDRRGAAG